MSALINSGLRLSKPFRVGLFFSVLVGLSHALPDALAKQPYKLEIIARDGDVIDGKTLDFTNTLPDRYPVINNNGNVAFHTRLSAADDPDNGVFTINDGLIAAAGQTFSGKTLTEINPTPPAINDINDVVFDASFEDGFGIFSKDRGLLVDLSEPVDGRTLLFSLFVLSVNNTGNVAYRSAFVNSAGDGLKSGIFTTTDGLIIAAGDTVAGQTLVNIGFPLLSDTDDIIFTGTVDNGTETTSAIISLNNGLLATAGEMINGRRTTELTFVWSNNADEFAYLTLLEDMPGDTFFRNAVVSSKTGVVTASGEVIEGNLLQNVSVFSLNNNGDIVYIARFDPSTGGGLAVVSNENGIIAQLGDAVDDLTLTNVIRPSLLSINDSGVVAFLGGFSDGTSGIVLATPVPEPGSVFILAVGLAWARRRRFAA